MTAPTVNPDLDGAFVAALAQRVAAIVAETVYRKLRGDVLMGDDALVNKAELAEIMRKHPDAMATWNKVGVGPQFVKVAGSREQQWRIGAIKHYLHEVKAGPMHLTPFLEAQARIERGWGSRPAAE